MEISEVELHGLQVMVRESTKSDPTTSFEVICSSDNSDPFPMGVVDGSLTPRFINASQHPASTPFWAISIASFRASGVNLGRGLVQKRCLEGW